MQAPLQPEPSYEGCAPLGSPKSCTPPVQTAGGDRERTHRAWGPWRSSQRAVGVTVGVGNLHTLQFPLLIGFPLKPISLLVLGL